VRNLNLLLFAALVSTSVSAQKLPNKQDAGLRIPADVKIDGKATEWNNTFQAYNNSTDFYYTMANSDDELYVVVQAKDQYVFKKIIDRGLTLSVKNPKNSKIANITYPHTSYTTKDGRVSQSFGINMSVGIDRVSEEEIAGYNNILKSKHKFIKVDGIDGVDSVVSVYNENGIRAAEHFDNNRIYTLEMAVKLKQLGFAANNGEKISFKLKVNTVEGAPVIDANTKMSMIGGGEMSPEMRQEAISYMTEKVVKMYQGTEFSGEYTLAK